MKKLKGTLFLPGDKSISHRAIMLGCIANGTTTIKGLLNAEDCKSTLNAFINMGVSIKQGKEVIIHGKGKYGLRAPVKEIDAGNSGTTMRIISGILSAQKFSTVITGDESLSSRPMDRIIKPLRMMDADITARNDKYPPVSIKGTDLKPIKYEMPVASAQVKSCILLAGLYASGRTIIVETAKSRDHTERMLKYFGAEISVSNNEISLQGPAELQGRDVNIPGDISSASFFMVGALITKGSEITIKNAGINPTRTGIIDVLKQMGASIRFFNKSNISSEPCADIHVKYSRLKGTFISPEMIPRLIDEIPVIAVAACFAEGKTEITGASELRVKESDRLRAISSQLSKMGADIKETSDGLIIKGGNLKGAEVDSSNDHRIAMALFIAGLAAQGKTKINRTECMDISYPGFMEGVRSLDFE